MDYQTARSGWVADYSDPNTFLDMFVTGGENTQTKPVGSNTEVRTGLLKRLAKKPIPKNGWKCSAVLKRF